MIFMVLYDALPYAIGAIGPKLGKKEKKNREGLECLGTSPNSWVAFT